MDARLRKIENSISDYLHSLRPTVFRLLNGQTFTTELDPLAYLMQRGTATPRGRIVGYEHPAGDIDGLSASLYELIDDGIRQGGLQSMCKGLESDPL